ncbi:MAG TPA: TonB-dependent receptor [Terriglobales bacterium]|nr:TonB-dependent receptor [Terriglobales bacterium]
MLNASAKHFMRITCLMALCLVIAVAAMAQSTTNGAISGTVTDQSGAVIPNAKVEIKNTGTNDTITATSDESGRFRASNLLPGTYDIKVTAGGFADYKASRMVVEVGRISNVDAKMNITGKGETVEVLDEAPVVNTERQDFATNINQEAIQNLPINGRRWSNYALLTPNANPDGNFGLISFRGISGLLNNSTVDGGDNNSNFYGEERGRTRLSYSTSQDSIREFQVNTSNFSAEYGRSAGGVVNTVTKSGTNSLHGSAYWFIRDNALGATNPSSLLSGQPYKADDRRDQFGGTIGGPIVKDRAFFFFNYDQQRRNFPGLAIPFTGTNSYGQYTVSNPVTAGKVACPVNGTAFSSTYTLGEGIFCRFGSVAAGQAAADAGYNFITSLLGTTPRRGDQLLFFPKVDLKVLGGNWATSYNWLNWNSPAGIQTQPTNTIAKDQFGNDLVRTRVLNSIFNRAIGAHTALELRFHWSSENLSGSWQDEIPGQPSVAGVTGSHAPGVSLTNWLNFGTQSYLPRPANPEEVQYQQSGNLAFSWGKHTTKLGAEFLHQTEEVQSLSTAYGTFSYTGTFAYANFLADAYNAGGNNFVGSGVRRCGTIGALGNPGTIPCYASLTQGVGTLGYNFSTDDWAFYIQDDWKLHPRLNLNFGLRYDRQIFPEAQFPNPALALTGTRANDANNFAPRVGFAYDIFGTGKFVVRGGYGVYYARISNSTLAAGLVNTGVAAAQPSYFITASATSPVYPNILSSTNVPASVGTPDVVYWDPFFRNPFIHQSDIVAEYEFMKNTVASVSYLNSKGRNLVNYLDTNLPASFQGNNTFTRPNGTTFTVPTYGTVARPNTAFQRITKIGNSVSSDYDAVVFQVTRRMTAGWQMMSSYTWSRSTDNGQNSTTFTTGNNALDPNNPNGEFGRSNFDTPHKFVFTAIWQPNFFKNEKNAAHYILDDWTLAPIISAYSGAVYTGTISGNLPSTLLGAVSTANCSSTHSAGINCASPGINRPADVQKNTYRTPTRQTVDFRVSRAFRITEGTGIEFLAEAFNLLNRSNVTSASAGQFNMGTCTGHSATTGGSNLSCTLTDNATFGQPASGGINNGTNLRERQIQFGLRFKF